MIILLPICSENKIVLTNFLLEKYDNYIIIKLFNRKYEETIDKIKVPLLNNYNCMSYLDLYFPLKLHIYDNVILFNNFLQKIYLSQYDNTNSLNIDFFYSLEILLKREFDLSFITLDKLKSYENIIWDYCNNYSYDISLTNSNTTIKELWEVIQLKLNSSLCFYKLYLDNSLSINKVIKKFQKNNIINKDLLSTIKSIKSIPLSIYSSNMYNIIEHYNNMVQQKVKLENITVGSKYFIKRTNMKTFFLIEIENIKMNEIYTINGQTFIFDNYEWYYYLPDLELNIDTIIFYFLVNDMIYPQLFDNTNLNIESIHFE